MSLSLYTERVVTTVTPKPRGVRWACQRTHRRFLGPLASRPSCRGLRGW